MSDDTTPQSGLDDKASVGRSEAHGAPNPHGTEEGLEDATGETPDAGSHRAETGVHAQPPATFTGLKVGKRKEVAAGLPAVMSSVRYALREAGPVRGARLLLSVSQKDGFDRPDSWPDLGDERSAGFCENGAKATLDEGTLRRVTPKFFAKHSVAELSERSDYWLNHQGRITEPMILRKGATHYEPISWPEAFGKIGSELKGLESPDEAVFYTSGHVSNEAAFLYQLFVRQYGTNNLPGCSNMGHESSGTALSETLGLGKGSVTLADFDYSDLIIVIGQNPGTNHPRMMSALERAKRNGAKVIAVNPLPEAGLTRFKNPQNLLRPTKVVSTLFGKGTELADLHARVRIGGDVPFLKGVMKELLEEEDRRPGEVFDGAFIREQTEGFEELVADLRAEDWDRIVFESGVGRTQLRETAELVMAAGRIIVCWATGLTQHTNAVGNVQEIVNLLLLKGSIGKPGAGTCPVRGHSNGQGNRTMGIWERPQGEFLDVLQREFGFEPPREHGFDAVEAIKAMHEGRAKVFLALGGNFSSAAPDTEYTAEALRKTRLTVHISTKLNRAHLVHGEEALILPCLGHTEIDEQAAGPQFVTVEDSMGVVHDSQGVLPPASEHLRSEVAIIAGIAEVTLTGRTRANYGALKDDYNRIRGHISRVIPGCEGYAERARGAGFYLPNGPREGKFTTDTGKAKFTVHPIPERPLEAGQFVMMLIRSHDQSDTVVYSLSDRYRGVYNERRVILLNPDDMAEQGIDAGDVLDLTGHFNGETRTAARFIAVPYEIPNRCAATYYPEANVLVPIGHIAEKSNTPVYKYVVITVAPTKYEGEFDPSVQKEKEEPEALEQGRPAPPLHA